MWLIKERMGKGFFVYLRGRIGFSRSFLSIPYIDKSLNPSAVLKGKSFTFLQVSISSPASGPVLKHPLIFRMIFYVYGNMV